jgi:hypothetical protein
MVEPYVRQIQAEDAVMILDDSIAEKNCTLIRYDIIVSLKNLYDQVQDEAIKQKALALIETEADVKYRKKYAGVWRK